MTEQEINKTKNDIENYYSVEATITDAINALEYVGQLSCDYLNTHEKVQELGVTLTPENIDQYLDTGMGIVYNLMKSVLVKFNASYAVLAREFYYLTASGVYLDMIASNYGIVRKQNIKAKVVVKIKLNAGQTLPYLIESGLTLKYNGNDAFILKDNVNFVSSDTAIVFFEAINAGEDKNYIQGQDLSFELRQDDNIDVVNSIIYNSAGALDYENDITVKTRIKFSFEKPSAGSFYQYKSNIYDLFPEISDVFILEVDEQRFKGKVQMWLKLIGGEQGDSNYLSIVKQTLAPISPSTDDIIVKYADKYNVDFATNNIIIYYTTILNTNEKNAIITRVSNLFANMSIGQKLFKSQIIDVIQHQFVNGVESEIAKIKGVEINNMPEIIIPTDNTGQTPIGNPSYVFPVNLTVQNITFSYAV